MRKVFSPPALIRQMGGSSHFNAALGKPVSGARELNDGFKAKSDEMSARMGFDVDYHPVDRRDTERLGVSGAGLEPTTKRLTDTGQRDPKLYV